MSPVTLKPARRARSNLATLRDFVHIRLLDAGKGFSVSTCDGAKRQLAPASC